MMHLSKPHVVASRVLNSIKRFSPTERPVLRLLLKRSRSARSAGQRAQAIRLARAALDLYPGDAATRLHLARCLNDPPVSGSDLSAIEEVINDGLGRVPGHSGFIGVYLEMVLQGIDHGADDTEIERMLRNLANQPPATVAKLLNAKLSRRAQFGDTAVATRCSRIYFEIEPTSLSAGLEHEMLLADGRVDEASVFADAAHHAGITSREDWTFQLNKSAQLMGRPESIVERLVELRPARERRYSEQLVRALSDLGRHQDILDYLDDTAHGLGEVTEAVFRFSALSSLGRHEPARDLIGVAANTFPHDIQLFRCLRQAFCYETDGWKADLLLLDRVMGIEHEFLEDDEQNLTMAHATALVTLYFELDRFSDVRRVAASCPPHSIGPSIRRFLARVWYLERDFIGALDHIDQLSSAALTWDIEKLRARIFLEQGRFSEAITARSTAPQRNGELDEVLYHALLADGQLDQAMGIYSPISDYRRLATAFGQRSERKIGTEIVDHRLIIGQAGPGDEVCLAGVFNLALERSTVLTVTCDPRLLSLFTRSFPAIDFIPVDRHHPPTVMDGSGAQVALRDLLNPTAFAIGEACTAVVPLRAIAQLKQEVLGASPMKATLIPDEAQVTEMRQRWHGHPTVGIAWRSEKGGRQRAIHYLTTADLRPLLEEKIQFVCLQYDATKAEREYLLKICGDRILFVDDIDVRNDLDSCAALVRSLSAVIGIGTTTVELSGAVGTPTVMIQPTNFGTWRSMSVDGSDYWHESVQVTSIAKPWITALLIQEAKQRLLALLSTP